MCFTRKASSNKPSLYPGLQETNRRAEPSAGGFFLLIPNFSNLGLAPPLREVTQEVHSHRRGLDGIAAEIPSEIL